MARGLSERPKWIGAAADHPLWTEPEEPTPIHPLGAESGDGWGWVATATADGVEVRWRDGSLIWITIDPLSVTRNLH